MPSNKTGNSIVETPTITTIYTLAGKINSCTATQTIQVNVIDCQNLFFGLTNVAEGPDLAGNDSYTIRFYVTATNGSSNNYSNVALNSDLKNTFPYPVTYSISSLPVIKSIASGLNANTQFDGFSNMSLTTPLTSTLFANKTDTVYYSVSISPHGFNGALKNYVVGLADFSIVSLSDTSNNGYFCDPDNDGNPKNNNLVTTLDILPIDLFIPEGFSPDDDGNNDYFRIFGLKEQLVNFIVFNRWGNKVYEASGSSIIWDGHSNNKGVTLGSEKLPPSTYFYILEFPGQKAKTIKGFLEMRY